MSPIKLTLAALKWPSKGELQMELCSCGSGLWRWIAATSKSGAGLARSRGRVSMSFALRRLANGSGRSNHYRQCRNGDGSALGCTAQPQML